jgi:hypothetical protein
MARRKRKAPEEVLPPTPEQAGKGDFARVLIADHKVSPFRRIPVIQTLASTGKISKRQYAALSYYRELAGACDRSPLRDSVGKMMAGEIGGGSGAGLPPAQLRNERELGWLEGELGSLRDIARAVAVDDVTLSGWAMRGGSVERRRTVNGKAVIWFEPVRTALKYALAEIRMAGERISAALESR